MTHAEYMLLAAVYGVYLLDCVAWLRAGESALTRTAQGWRTHTVERLSFTLAGHKPVIVGPLLFRPGFLRAGAPPAARTLKLVARRLDAQWLLLVFCRAQAVLLLIYLPLLLVLHRLVAIWPLYLGVLLLLHMLICVVAARALRRAAAPKLGTTIASLAVNPVGATRVLTPLSQALYEQASKRRTRIPLN